jgi:hypothetical protein
MGNIVFFWHLFYIEAYISYFSKFKSFEVSSAVFYPILDSFYCIIAVF